LSIFFHKEGINFNVREKQKIKRWIKKIIENEEKELGELNIILTRDKELLELNKTYLSRKYLTDVITFEYSHEKKISGDIYLSIERVRENALKFNERVDREILRVIIHGILHLMGYSDKKDDEQKKMRQKEDECLYMFDKMQG
jgi:rRNA maturation RNase YbeY